MPGAGVEPPQRLAVLHQKREQVVGQDPLRPERQRHRQLHECQ